MSNNKLIRVLEKLTLGELQQLRKFLTSPYFNRNPVYEKLLNVFEKQRFTIKLEENLKNIFYEEAFPGEDYNDLKLRHAFSDFLELIEAFLSVQATMADKGGIKLKVMRYYGENGLDKHFASARKELFSVHSLENPNREEEFLLSYHANNVINNFLISENLRHGKHNLVETMYSLDSFYLLTKLRLLCEILNYRNIITIDVDLPFLDEIIPLLQKSPYTDIPAICIYRDIFLTLTDGGEEHYHSLKRRLEKDANLFSKDESRGMYFYALNYCVKKINAGQTFYVKEIFEFYKRMLHSELLIENGHLPHSHYKNIVAAALRMGEYAWTLDFIEKYKTRIEEENRDNAYTFNLAKYYFYVKDYDKVIRLLHKVEYEDLFYNLDSKVLLLKTFYECNEVKSLFSLLDTFKTYLQRNKVISPMHKKVYGNLVLFTRKLLNTNPGQQPKIEKLKTELKNIGAIADISWLEEKLAELAA